MSRMQNAVLPAAILASLITGLLAFQLPLRGTAEPPAQSGSTSVSSGEPSQPLVPSAGDTCEVSARFPQAVLDWCSLITRSAAETSPGTRLSGSSHAD